MRRKDREITDFSEIIAVMRACEVCHVAFGDDEYPYVVPMNFGFDVQGKNVTLYFHGASQGKKHDLIRKNNKVAFVMEYTHGIFTGKYINECESTMKFECVMGTGMINYVEDAKKIEALHSILNHYNISQKNTYHFNTDILSRTTVLQIKVHSLSGKKREIHGQTATPGIV